MKVPFKAAAAVFGGMAAVTLAVGSGGVGISPTGGTAAPATHSSSSIASAPTVPTGPGVHPATLAGCISGLDC